MATKVCIFNSTTNLIDVVNGVATYTGNPATAGAPIVLNAFGALDSSFFNASPFTAVASVALSPGDLVNVYYANGVSGPGVYAQLASAEFASPPLPAMGYVTASYNIGDPCTVLTTGTVDVPITSGFTTANIGQPVYLSSSVPGSVTPTAPTSPNLIQPLGFVFDVQLSTSPFYVQFPFTSFPLATTGGGGGGGINQLTGDGTAGPGTGSQAFTLATVNSDVGSFTSANITVNAKGLITAAANGTSGGGGGLMEVTLPTPNGGTTYTMPSAPIDPADTLYFVNGLKRIYGTYYTISGTTLTILSGSPPNAPDTHEMYFGSVASAVSQAVFTSSDTAFAGPFQFAHGLSFTPTTIIPTMTSDGHVWLQTPTFADATYIYLVASDPGISGIVVCFP